MRQFGGMPPDDNWWWQGGNPLDAFFRSREADPQAEADPPANPPQSNTLDASFEARVENKDSLIMLSFDDSRKHSKVMF